MKITVLGSGTILSAAHRNPSGYLLEYKGNRALIDCGPGILNRLKNNQIDPLSISAVFLSHFHLDHCADFFPLLMNRALLDAAANQHLTVFGSAALGGWFNTLAGTQGTWLHNHLPQIHQIETGPLNWAGINILSANTHHTGDSLAFRFETGKSLFYSGDTDYGKELLPLAREADCAVVECSLPDSLYREGHMTPERTGRFAREANVKRLILTHLYPQNERAELIREVQQQFSGPIDVAEDYAEYVI